VIDLVITDVDGVLTDNRIWYTNAIPRQPQWAFNQYDLEAVKLLKENEIRVIMLSGAHNHAFRIRADVMGVNGYYQSNDKLQWVISHYGMDRLDTTAFIGNDIIDHDLLTRVQYPACPSDASGDTLRLVKALGGHITEAKGGYGCFREWVEYILLMF